MSMISCNYNNNLNYNSKPFLLYYSHKINLMTTLNNINTTEFIIISLVYLCNMD